MQQREVEDSSVVAAGAKYSAKYGRDGDGGQSRFVRLFQDATR